MTVAADPFDELFAAYADSIKQLGTQARALVREAWPEAQERVYPTGWSAAQYASGPKMSDVLVVIKPAKQHVTLLFGNGASLPDPDHLLEGAGKGARHVKLRTSADIERPAVRALLDAAIAGH
jgi:hypothetical protein